VSTVKHFSVISQSIIDTVLN